MVWMSRFGPAGSSWEEALLLSVDLKLAIRRQLRAVHLHDAASPNARSSRSNSIGMESASA
jgi:hypothetical protein